jgi:hypothetical protein
MFVEGDEPPEIGSRVGLPPYLQRLAYYGYESWHSYEYIVILEQGKSLSSADPVEFGSLQRCPIKMYSS